MYYIGIDGGGTKTSYTIMNENGIKIDQIITGTSHYGQIGYDNLRELLDSSVNELISRNNINRSEVKSIFIGLPGYGEVKSVKKELDQIVEDLFNDFTYAVGNDVEVGLYGSLAGNSGINIVSGTGSIALGKDKNNKSIRCGGWGDYIGDEGSAHWIGKKTLEVFSKEADNRLERGVLYNNVKKCLNIEDDFDIIDHVLNTIKKDRTKVSEFSKICFDSAVEGDENAIKIFSEAAYELALLVKMIINRLDFDEEVLVSYSGGVFKSGELILSPLNEELKGYNVKLIEPILGPSEGALLLAYKLMNTSIPHDIIENLKQEIKVNNFA